MGAYSPVDSSWSPWEEVGDDSSLNKDTTRRPRRTAVTDGYTEGRRRKIADTIGITRITILSLGTLCIFAATGVLVFLWRGAATAARQGDPGTAWKNIGNAGWATVTVAICSAILRTAVSLQAGVVMSMVASILLERHPIRLRDTAFLSITRAVSIQPVSLLFNSGRGVLKSSSSLSVLIILAGVIAIASTFTSTILLSDFANIIAVGDTTTTMIGYTQDRMSSRIDFWKSPPGPYARFAEFTNDSRLTGPHIDDTGLTLRVPLPLASSDERQTLRSYVGPAVVFDSRVICVSPKLNISSLNRSRSEETFGQSETSVAIQGSFTFDMDLPLPIEVHKNAGALKFLCQLPQTDRSPGMTWNLSVCILETLDSGNVASNGASLVSIRPFLQRYEGLQSYVPFSFAIFNVTPPTQGFSQLGSSDKVSYPIPKDSLTITTDGPWAKAKVSGVDLIDGASFAVTVCMTDLEGQTHNVTLTSDSDGPEPTMAWTGTPRQAAEQNGSARDSTSVRRRELYIGFSNSLHNDSTYHTYDSTSVRRQLNAGSGSLLTPPERGLMTLSPDATNWSASLSTTMFGFDIKALFPHFAFFDLSNTVSEGTAVMSYDTGYARGFDLGHPMHTALFADALMATGSPARALQAWLTTLLTRYLYDSLGRFTIGDEAVMVRSTTVLAPARWAGLVTIVAVLVVHLAIVAWATVCFVRTTQHTLLGHSWLGVAQVVSDTTLPLLWQAGDLKDGEVGALIREEVGESARYGVVRLRKTGRTALAPIQ